MTKPQEAGRTSQMTDNYNPPELNELFNKETIDRSTKLVEEALKSADKIRSLFANNTRGMMVFMYAIGLLGERYPEMFDLEKTKQRIAQWLAAGEPEDVNEVAPRIVEKLSRIRQGIAAKD